MSSEPLYRKPGFWKRAAYFLLLFLVAQFIARATIGVIGIEMGFCYRTRQDLDEKLDQFKVMVWETIFQRIYAPTEKFAELTDNSSRQAFADLAADYPEVVAFYSLKANNLINLYLQPGSALNAETLNPVVAAVIDTITPYHANKQPLPIEGSDLFLSVKFLPGEKRITVATRHYFKDNLPAILKGAEKVDPVLYKKIFGRYPVEFYSAEFYDSSDSLYYTFGKKRGKAWSDGKSWDMKFLAWKMKFYYYPDHEIEIKYAERAGKVTWFTIGEFAVTLILLVLLAHFSPYLHGYSQVKKE